MIPIYNKKQIELIETLRIKSPILRSELNRKIKGGFNAVEIALLKLEIWEQCFKTKTKTNGYSLIDIQDNKIKLGNIQICGKDKLGNLWLEVKTDE